MSAPLFDQMLVSIFDVPARRVDQVASLIWRGHAEGHLDDEQAERLSGAVQLRRSKRPCARGAVIHEMWRR